MSAKKSAKKSTKKADDPNDYKVIDMSELRLLRHKIGDQMGEVSKNTNKRVCKVTDLLLPENRELCDLFHHPYCRKNVGVHTVDGVHEPTISCRIYYNVNGEIINHAIYCDLFGVPNDAYRWKEVNISYR
jgi:hypothetical protein